MIPSQLPPLRHQPPYIYFDQGAGSTSRKVGGFVLTLLTAIVSFLLLPWEAAFFVSAGATALLSLYCCSDSAPRGSPIVIQAREERPWYSQLIPLLVPRFHPVHQPGRRVPVGPGYTVRSTAPFMPAYPVNVGYDQAHASWHRAPSAANPHTQQPQAPRVPVGHRHGLDLSEVPTRRTSSAEDLPTQPPQGARVPVGDHGRRREQGVSAGPSLYQTDSAVNPRTQQPQASRVPVGDRNRRR